MDEIRIFGYCKCCGEEVTDEYGEYCVNEDGEVFCNEECAFEYYGITKVEV